MSTPFSELNENLRVNSRRWLVTGGAGFIGSHLIEHLLQHDQAVICLDNLSTGYASNLEALKVNLSASQKERLEVIEGDLGDYDVCVSAVKNVDYILHQGALGSVPRSIEDPITSHISNVTGTLNLFTAVKNSGIKRVVYASSSSVYGDEASLPMVEEKTGNLLSPYAATKAICEVYANAFAHTYGMEFVGLRYFNVFGPRQDPNGPYAAVIPIWVKAMLQGMPVFINGDGETTRDFVYVANVVQANLLAATAASLEHPGRAFNVAIGDQISLNQLFHQIRSALLRIRPDLNIADPVYRDFRSGDVRYSTADFSRAREELGFEPTHSVADGIDLAVQWYSENSG
ncbi:SDR family oxidoreductase [bacterium]|nr:SDR family oxidoreductase [Verrucomicrobiales bacterium]MDC0275389.1 SDR family oxidoreductase [Verrucomicrobiales bacterium]MDC0312120.1 SDR family oxidoreductase [bacterium]